MAVGGQITVSGLVENNVVAVGGSIVLTRKPLSGAMLFVSAELSCRETALRFSAISPKLTHPIFPAVASAFYDETEEWSWLVDIIYFCFFALLFTLALLMAFLFPRPLNAIVDSIKAIKRNLFSGAFWQP